jgi:4-hydroxy-4-methyl-2-oxoglutarate aldolase
MRRLRRQVSGSKHMHTIKARNQVAAGVLKQLRAIDTCTVSNAIEQLDVRLRNEGFADNSVRCLLPKLPPMVGYAAPGRIRTFTAPLDHHWYYHNMDWWSYIQTIPAPRVIVLQDVDERPGFGALFGEMHTHICQVLDCDGYVTNGTVRDLPGIERLGFHLFASGVSVSHAYAHIADFGEPVEVGGLRIHPGDLLHGDAHGVLSVPLDIAPEVPGIAAKLLEEERQLVSLCHSSNFSLERLRKHIEASSDYSEHEPK